MAIFRGSGGAGDATGDATNASVLAVAAAAEAQASAASAASSATNAASSASAAASSETDAGNSATAAATSATDAAASASTASTQATNAASSATAAASSASAASSSASSASSSASSASTSASTASTSATNAASSASSASTSASSASTSATNAANSASAASTSATNAANSATAAATSEANAAATLANVLVKTNNLSDVSSASTARTNLGLAIGTNVQAYSSELQAISSSGNAMFKNRIINGAMMIDQRNAGASVTVNSVAFNYTLDRWFGYGQVADGVFTFQRSTTAPTGFTNSALLTVTTADASIGSAQVYGFGQKIEGFNVADFGWGTASAQNVTLSFQVRSSVTGTYSVTFFNGAFNRGYTATFNIAAANTFETKTITIPGDTSGTWATDNSNGLTIWISLGTGSTYTGTAGTWNAGTTYAATGQINLISTNGATFYITGVQLEKGSTATSFDYRPYGAELALCQRYYWKCTASLGSSFSTSGAGGGGVRMPVTMRTTPTLEAGSSFTVSSGSVGTPAAYTGTGGGTGGDAVNVYNSASNWTTGQAISLTAGFTAEL